MNGLLLAVALVLAETPLPPPVLGNSPRAWTEAVIATALEECAHIEDAYRRSQLQSQIGHAQLLIDDEAAEGTIAVHSCQLAQRKSSHFKAGRCAMSSRFSSPRTTSSARDRVLR